MSLSNIRLKIKAIFYFLKSFYLRISFSLQPRNQYFNQHFVDSAPIQIIYWYYKYFLQIIKYVLSLCRLNRKTNTNSYSIPHSDHRFLQ